MSFEPSGITNDDIRIAKSIVDYIFRWFGKKFLTVDQQEEVGILSTDVKAKMAAAYANGGTAPAAPATADPPARQRCSTRRTTQSSARGAAAG
jgi:ribonucleoside-diphosphate reductase alpha chain